MIQSEGKGCDDDVGLEGDLKWRRDNHPKRNLTEWQSDENLRCETLLD
jgi:hypothetical protein